MALLPRPLSICALAWESVFARSFGLARGPSTGAEPRHGHTLSNGECEYTISEAAWLECAGLGCVWCGFLAKNLKFEFPHYHRCPLCGRISKVRIRVKNAEDRGLLMRITISWKPCCTTKSSQSGSIYLHTTAGAFGSTDSIVPLWIVLKQARPSDDPAAAYVEGRLRIPHVGSPKVLALAKACIEECAREHKACRAITLDPALLPRRLINCSDPRRVRIVEIDGSTSGRYVALSYVWGGPQPHRTTRKNLASYKRDGIDPAILPQTIQDAIRVTRALGILFLWIDSLCIIQDSDEDKHRELASMRDVYRYAYVTIDAARTAMVTEGFLHDCRPLSVDATLPFICPSECEDSWVVVANPVTEVGKVYLVPGLSQDDRRKLAIEGE